MNSSKILSDFKCKACRHLFEGWIDRTDKSCTCPHCGSSADRHLSGGNFALPGHDLGFPTAASKWDRRHRNANADNLKELNLPT